MNHINLSNNIDILATGNMLNGYGSGVVPGRILLKESFDLFGIYS